jgi:hypothetical protein
MLSLLHIWLPSNLEMIPIQVLQPCPLLPSADPDGDNDICHDMRKKQHCHVLCASLLTISMCVLSLYACNVVSWFVSCVVVDCSKCVDFAYNCC